MLNALRKRTQDDQGFTLIELMVVVLIIAILIAIAIPTFLGLRQRAQDRAAQSNLRNGLTAAKAFYTDAETYTGFTAVAAKAIEPSLTFTDAACAATLNQVCIKVAAAPGQEIVLTTRSASNALFCIADSSSVGTARGKTDAANFAACTGGW
jgi:type IV pilus assembly protein PilA